MRKLYLILIFIVIWSNAQSQFTPNCTSISSYIVPTIPLTQSQINSINTQQQNQFPNVIKLEDPNSSYNCHNYAWVKRDGGSTFWLNSPGDDAFWNDNNYIQTSNTTEA